ncbi:sigma-54-dependent Fis family transcriptional regulator [Alishewanella longhuensis]|uniref:Sigma-54-dependent Fis family transcriptional regulator n=1 Tax=Alishewanella longhuensis TaxID=1091037 RepID=A0ABQ3KVY2_9ALTE|nr:sigma-54 dependent transcriptional regulator [Alishewanella longhuensis]GHG59256.1 sigma-54-dependent Fis family transcriptional regulator [Alishewanella longhuensis]
MKYPATVLILDDNLDLLTAARLCLKPHFQQVLLLSEPAELLTALTQQRVDILLLDMNFQRDASSGEEGIFYLKQALNTQPDLKVVMMTAYAELPLAVRAMQLGASDFIAKPWQNEQLLRTLQQQLVTKAASHVPVTAAVDSLPMLGESPAMQQVQHLISKAAATEANILLSGESGTGKALAAQAIHAASARSLGPLITVDMGAIHSSLFESELFGHKKGAFTDAKSDYSGRLMQASGGTLFLDELGNLPLAQQAKLLTALQNRTVVAVGSSQPQPFDARLICATNDNLAQKVQSGEFRQDLLYRINTIEITLPPLRQRREDISLLLNWYLQHYCEKYQQTGLRITPGDLKLLCQYDWPGNVRQLAHAVERAVVLAEGGIADFSQLFTVAASNSSGLAYETAGSATEQDFTLDYVEQKTIAQALQYYQGNISQAAKALGLTRAALYRRMEKYQL